MKLRRQLHLCFAAVVLVVACAGFSGLVELNKLISAHDGAVAGYRQARDVDVLQSSFKTQLQQWNNTLLRDKDQTARARDWQAFQDGERRVAGQVTKLLDALPAGEERALIAQFGRAHAQMGQDCRKGYAQFEAAGFEAAGDAAISGKDRALSGLLVQASDGILAQTAHKVAEAAAGSRRARLFSLVATVLGAAAAILAGIVVSRSIVRPLERAVGVANIIADPAHGLGKRIEVDSNELHAAWDEPVSAARMALRALPPVGGKRGTPARVAGDWQAT